MYFNSTIYYVQSGEAIQSGETMRTSIRSCKSFLTNVDIIRFMLMFIAGGQPANGLEVVVLAQMPMLSGPPGWVLGDLGYFLMRVKTSRAYAP